MLNSQLCCPTWQSFSDHAFNFQSYLWPPWLVSRMAMTQPDCELIAQVMLFSQGFWTAESLASKIISFNICDEQLSPQLHYDSGLHALKAMLANAGILKYGRLQNAKAPLNCMMVILDKYQDELTEPSANNHTDTPPLYETITTAHSGRPSSGPSLLVNEKSPWQSVFPTAPCNSSSFPSDAGLGTSRPASQVSQPNPWSWLSTLSFTSSCTSKQVHQTVLSLICDLVLNVESPDLLNSCANTCWTYSLDLSAILQEPYIVHHSAVYWRVLNHHDTLLPSLLAYTALLSQSTMLDVWLTCLAPSNQVLFQSLRCQCEPFTKQMTPLNTSPGK